MTLNHLIVIIISFQKSIQRELDSFFKAVSGEDFNIREVTKGAFSQARLKLNEWAFKRLNEVSVNTFYDEAPYHKWHGRRVVSVDGTRLLLPNHKSIHEEFGVHGFGPNADSKRALAMSSILYDPLNQIVLDGQLAPYSSNERELLVKHLEYVKKGDVILLDRGYNCTWLLFLLYAKGIDFCMRFKKDWWLEVKEFYESKDQERMINFQLPTKDHEKLSAYQDWLLRTIKCRFIKIELPNGEIEILCTSLVNTKQVLISLSMYCTLSSG